MLRPSHHKAPVKRKAAGQVSKTQIQAQISEAATGITFKVCFCSCFAHVLLPCALRLLTFPHLCSLDLPQGAGEEESDAAGGKRKRKRPPQLTEALGPDGPRSSRRTRGDGRIFSPSEFAPINALGQLEVRPKPKARIAQRSLTHAKIQFWRLQPFPARHRFLSWVFVDSDTGGYADAGQHTVG